MTKECGRCGIEVLYKYRPPSWCSKCSRIVRRENRRKDVLDYRERSAKAVKTKDIKIPEKYLVRGLK